MGFHWGTELESQSSLSSEDWAKVGNLVFAFSSFLDTNTGLLYVIVPPTPPHPPCYIK